MSYIWVLYIDTDTMDMNMNWTVKYHIFMGHQFVIGISIDPAWYITTEKTVKFNHIFLDQTILFIWSFQYFVILNGLNVYSFE